MFVLDFFRHHDDMRKRAARLGRHIHAVLRLLNVFLHVLHRRLGLRLHVSIICAISVP